MRKMRGGDPWSNIDPNAAAWTADQLAIQTLYLKASTGLNQTQQAALSAAMAGALAPLDAETQYFVNQAQDALALAKSYMAPAPIYTPGDKSVYSQIYAPNVLSFLAGLNMLTATENDAAYQRFKGIATAAVAQIVQNALYTATNAAQRAATAAAAAQKNVQAIVIDNTNSLKNVTSAIQNVSDAVAKDGASLTDISNGVIDLTTSVSDINNAVATVQGVDPTTTDAATAIVAAITAVDDATTTTAAAADLNTTAQTLNANAQTLGVDATLRLKFLTEGTIALPAGPATSSSFDWSSLWPYALGLLGIIVFSGGLNPPRKRAA